MERRMIVIACKVLKLQIDLQGNPNADYVYLKQGLHMTPDLQYEEMDGSIDYLRKLLHGPYNEEFVVVENGIALEDSMFR